MFYQIVHKRKIKEKRAAKIAAQVLLGLKCLHENEILYRDLKPMNILLDQHDNVKLTDFGLSKLNFKTLKKTRKMSLWGTVEYLPPEIAMGDNYRETADWWSFGIIIYEMLSGKLPFEHNERTIVIKDIISKGLKFNKTFSEDAKDMVSKLLIKDPEKRLGANGPEEIMNHPFFKDINWDEIGSESKETLFSVKTPRGYSKYWYGQSPESSVISEKGEEDLDIPNFTYIFNSELKKASDRFIEKN